jgi:hypothetical protein
LQELALWPKRLQLMHRTILLFLFLSRTISFFQFQKRDNIEEFGTKTVWHEPKVIHQNLETIGFAKNIYAYKW